MGGSGDGENVPSVLVADPGQMGGIVDTVRLVKAEIFTACNFCGQIPAIHYFDSVLFEYGWVVVLEKGRKIFPASRPGKEEMVLVKRVKPEQTVQETHVCDFSAQNGPAFVEWVQSAPYSLSFHTLFQAIFGLLLSKDLFSAQGSRRVTDFRHSFPFI